jgi:excisionase family DNA binding protein
VIFAPVVHNIVVVDSGRRRTRRYETLPSMPVQTETGGSPRFLHLADVAEILNISAAQAYALVRSGELPAIKVGGRGQWRVEASQLEAYIQRAYDETKRFVEEHPFGRADDEVEDLVD